MSLDSEAALASRLVDLVLATYRGSLQALGWTTSRSFAFPVATHRVALTRPVLLKSGLCRFCAMQRVLLRQALKVRFFESYTLMGSDMRKVERVEDELTGLQLSGRYECAHLPKDKAVQRLCDGVVRYFCVD